MQKILSGFSLEQDGWIFMWLIAIFLLVGIAFILERFYYINLKSGSGRKKFMAQIAVLIRDGKHDEALSLAKSSSIPLAKCVEAILENKSKGEKGMTSAVDAVFLTEAPRVNRYLNIMLTLANLATLTGLIGTIYGLIKSFDAVANLPASERPTALADGISVAMSTTFGGLVVAIPLMGFQGYFTTQSDRIIEEMEEKSLKIINSIA